MNVIVAFSRRERLREIGASMPVSIQVSLEEGGTGGILGGISGNGESSSKIRQVKNWL